jgi:hypothetical protein
MGVFETNPRDGEDNPNPVAEPTKTGGEVGTDAPQTEQGTEQTTEQGQPDTTPDETQH